MCVNVREMVGSRAIGVQGPERAETRACAVLSGAGRGGRFLIVETGEKGGRMRIKQMGGGCCGGGFGSAFLNGLLWWDEVHNLWFKGAGTCGHVH